MQPFNSKSFRDYLVSILDTKSKRTSLLIAIIFGLLTPFDYSVYALDIPEKDNLNISEGVVTFGASRRRGTPLLLKSEGKILKLLCRGTPSRNKTCILKMERHMYAGKIAKVWWYEANTYGNLLRERRLLQLEMDNKIYLDYEKQKERYLNQKSWHFYFISIVTFLSFFIFLLLQLSEKPTFNKNV